MRTPDFSKLLIIVVGDVMLDRYLWGDVERISPEAPVPVVRITHRSDTVGGAGNVALNLQGLGCRTHLLGVRGDDSPGRYLLKRLRAYEIPSDLVVARAMPTTTKTRIIGQGQQLVRLDEEMPAELSTRVCRRLIKRLEALLPDAQGVVISDYGKGLFITDLAGQIIQRCRAAGRPVFVDPKGSNWQRYAGANGITPNESELQQVAPFNRYDDQDLTEKAQGVLQCYQLESLVVTRGSRGMSLFHPQRPAVHIPTKAREVFDVSGAGDTVIATLTAAVAAGMPLRPAARLANVAAGVVVGKIGTQPIKAHELRQALNERGPTGSGKILNRQDACAIVAGWQAEQKQVVFTNGCFDILHIGHLTLLRRAAEQGDRLVVGLNSDTSVRRLKGNGRPIMPQSERAALLANLECVDLVVIFDEETPRALIRAMAPNVLVKGGDYTPDQVVGRDIVEAAGGKVVIVPLAGKISTTTVIDRVQKQPDDPAAANPSRDNPQVNRSR